MRIPESAVRARKMHIPIITATDCGAVLEIIKHMENGLTAKPDVTGIAQTLDLVVTNQTLQKRLSQENLSPQEIFVDANTVTESLVE